MKTIVRYIQHVVGRDIIFKHEKKLLETVVMVRVRVCLVKNALSFNCQNIKTAMQFKFITKF